MVEGVEGCLHYTAYFFSVLRTFAVCSAPIRGCRVSGERWMGPDFGDRGRASCPPYMNRWVLVWALGLSSDFDSSADGDEVVKLDHVGIP
jgi:hypothetical protein